MTNKLDDNWGYLHSKTPPFVDGKIYSGKPAVFTTKLLAAKAKMAGPRDHPWNTLLCPKLDQRHSRYFGA